MINDKSLQSSVLNKFLIKPNDESVVIPKESIANISNGLTSVQNAFNQVKAYSTNISRIQRAIADASLVSKKESTLENRAASNVAPVDTGSDIASLFPQLSKALDDLAKSFEQLNLSQQVGPGLGAPSPQGEGGMGLGTMLAGGAIAAGIGGAMLFSGSAEAAEPEPEQLPPPTPEPEPQPRPDQRPAASEVAAQTQENIAESRAQNEQTPQKIEQRDRRAERLATQTAQDALRQSDGSRVERIRAPQPTQQMESWSSRLSSYIGQSVRATEARMAAQAAGSPGGFVDGGQDGDQGDSTGSASPSNTADFIAYYESYIGRAVDIGDGHQTLGYGHVIQPQEVKQGFIDIGGGGKIPVTRGRHNNGMGTPITKPQATSLLQVADLPKYVAGARRAIGSANWSKLNEAQETALVSYTYNAGEGGMRQLGKQGLVDAIAAGDSQRGADVIRTKGKRRKGSRFEKGLTRRRNDEANLFASGKMPGGVKQGQGAPGTYTSGSQSKVQEFASGAVRGMSAGQGQAQLNSMGISGTNGNIPDSKLARLTAPGTSGHKAAPAAAAGMSALIIAAARQGIKIGVTDSYRSYAAQVAVKRKKPNLAAKPGTSNHGWGLAFDLSDGGKPLTLSSPAYRFLKANGPKFGIYGPLAKRNGSIFEIWHWEYRGGGSARPAVVPVTPPAQQQTAGPPLRSAAGTTINNAAVSNPGAVCKCDEPTIVTVPAGGGNPAATAANYLSGARPPRQAIRYNVNTAEDYKIYFNAA